jgi:murein DD-endopeptidase MepM/ murein hydrolase activator NlpD
VNDGFLVKIIPPEGYQVYRLHLSRAQLAGLVALVMLLIAGAVGVHIVRLHAAASAIANLEAQRADQERKLELMEQTTQTLQHQTADSAKEIDAIRRALGQKSAVARATHAYVGGSGGEIATLQARLRRLEADASQTSAATRRLATLASRVLNLRHLQTIARERMIAAIPSLNPVAGDVASGFGYRVSPWPEFHKGIDLAADYGQAVRASADGTVVWAGYEGGGFGNKVDIDHGNGYHTWYCHLSRIGVVSGQHVTKGETIAAVGSTGESTGPHLHYQVMLNGAAIDPEPFLNGVPPKVLATLPGDSTVQ